MQITPNPIYIHGADTKIFNQKAKVIAELYPGDSIVKKIAPLKGSVRSIGKLDIKKIAPDKLQIKVPDNSHNGAYPLLSSDNGKVAWVVVKMPLEVKTIELVKGVKTKLALALSVENHSKRQLPLKVVVDLGNKGRKVFRQSIKPKSTIKLLTPLKLSGNINANETLKLYANISSGVLSPLELSQKFSFLSAHCRTRKAELDLPNSVTFSNAQDSSTATFTYDDKNFYIDIKVKDNKFYQQYHGGNIWKMDSIQIAFDTHPDEKDIYNPLAGIFTKKLTSLNFAKTPKGVLVFRHETHNKNKLAFGDVTKDFEIDITRNKKTKTTNYSLVVPWQQIGLNSVKKGQRIGLSILTNDSDGAKDKRRTYSYFGGITQGFDYTKFGALTLL